MYLLALKHALDLHSFLRRDTVRPSTSIYLNQHVSQHVFRLHHTLRCDVTLPTSRWLFAKWLQFSCIYIRTCASHRSTIWVQYMRIAYNKCYFCYCSYNSNIQLDFCNLLPRAWLNFTLLLWLTCLRRNGEHNVTYIQQQI